MLPNFWSKVSYFWMVGSSLLGLFTSLIVFVFVVGSEFITKDVVFFNGRETECPCSDNTSDSTPYSLNANAHFIYGSLLLNGYESIRIAEESAKCLHRSVYVTFMCYIFTQLCCVIMAVNMLFLVKFAQSKIKRILLINNYISYTTSIKTRRVYIILSYFVVGSVVISLQCILLFVASLSAFRFGVGLDSEESIISWSYMTIRLPLMLYKSWHSIMAVTCSCNALGYFITIVFILHIYISHVIRIAILLFVSFVQAKVMRIYFFRDRDDGFIKSRMVGGSVPSYQSGDHFVVNATYSDRVDSTNKNMFGGYSNHNVTYEEQSTAF